jgi:hypothetical protein
MGSTNARGHMQRLAERAGWAGLLCSGHQTSYTALGGGGRANLATRAAPALAAPFLRTLQVQLLARLEAAGIWKIDDRYAKCSGISGSVRRPSPSVPAQKLV